jgi:hypothetical protein
MLGPPEYEVGMLITRSQRLVGTTEGVTEYKPINFKCY